MQRGICTLLILLVLILALLFGGCVFGYLTAQSTGVRDNVDLSAMVATSLNKSSPPATDLLLVFDCGDTPEVRSFDTLEPHKVAASDIVTRVLDDPEPELQPDYRFAKRLGFWLALGGRVPQCTDSSVLARVHEPTFWSDAKWRVIQNLLFACYLVPEEADDQRPAPMLTPKSLAFWRDDMLRRAGVADMRSYRKKAEIRRIIDDPMQTADVALQLLDPIWSRIDEPEVARSFSSGLTLLLFEARKRMLQDIKENPTLAPRIYAAYGRRAHSVHVRPYRSMARCE